MAPAVAKAFVHRVKNCSVLALDVGTVFVGVAGARDVLVDPPRPLKSYYHLLETDPGHFPARLSNLIQAHAVDLLVVGWPIAHPGESDIRDYISRFTRNFQSFGISLPVVLVDERHSTNQAKNTLFQIQRNLSKNKDLVDQTAACVILFRFAESLSH